MSKFFKVAYRDTRGPYKKNIEFRGALVGGGVLAPLAAAAAAQPIGLSVFKNKPYKPYAEVEGLVGKLSDELDVPKPVVVSYPGWYNNAAYDSVENELIFPVDTDYNIQAPDSIVAHEMGHAANQKTMGDRANNYLRNFIGIGPIVTVPTGAGLVTFANPDSKKAKVAPWLAASPWIAQTVGEGIATGRGLAALWKVKPSTVGEKLKHLGMGGRALLTYAAPAIGMVGALETIRRYRSYKEKYPGGNFGRFFLRKKY